MIFLQPQTPTKLVEDIQDIITQDHNLVNLDYQYSMGQVRRDRKTTKMQLFQRIVISRARG